MLGSGPLRLWPPGRLHQLSPRAARWWLSPGPAAPSAPAGRFHAEATAGSAVCLTLNQPPVWGSRGQGSLQAADSGPAPTW